MSIGVLCIYFVLLYFIVYWYLRRWGCDSRLEVVGLEEALEIEDLELILLREREKLTHRRIGLDDLLHHQAVLLRIAADARRNLRAAEERRLGDTEERAERIRDRRRLREDSLLLGLILAIRRGRGLATATLLSLLELTRDLLLKLLHAREDIAERGTEAVDLLDEAVELGDDVHRLAGRRGRRRRRRRGRRLDVGDRGRRNRCDNRGGDRRGNGRRGRRGRRGQRGRAARSSRAGSGLAGSGGLLGGSWC